MSDTAQLLARYRVRLGFVSALVAIWLSRPTPRSLAVGAAIAMAGELLRIWAAGHLEKGREVTASGPYRMTRHPLYLGSTIIAVGFAIASASVATAVLVIVYLVLTYGAAITSEEAHLTEKFGSAYPDYRQGRAPEAIRRFSVDRAIRNREYRAVAGLFLVLALLVWKVL
jgi:protein-S-isoprenylcysteine O-methyltransferase Ste14